jgi:hypothetical protein
MDPDQLLLFDAGEQAALLTELEVAGHEDCETDASSDEPPSPPRRRRGHGRNPLPEHMPRERVVCELTEEERACCCCGELRHVIGEKASEHAARRGHPGYHPPYPAAAATIRRAREVQRSDGGTAFRPLANRTSRGRSSSRSPSARGDAGRHPAGAGRADRAPRSEGSDPGGRQQNARADRSNRGTANVVAVLPGDRRVEIAVKFTAGHAELDALLATL